MRGKWPRRFPAYGKAVGAIGEYFKSFVYGQAKLEASLESTGCFIFRTQRLSTPQQNRGQNADGGLECLDLFVP